MKMNGDKRVRRQIASFASRQTQPQGFLGREANPVHFGLKQTVEDATGDAVENSQIRTPVKTEQNPHQLPGGWFYLLYKFLVLIRNFLF